MFAYVGSFTTEKRKSAGRWHPCLSRRYGDRRVDHMSSTWAGSPIPPIRASPDQRFLYLVHGDEDYATAFALDPADGSRPVLNRAAAGGSNGVRQALDKSRQVDGGRQLCERHGRGHGDRRRTAR